MKILKKRILAYTLALAIILSSLVFGVSTISAETPTDYDAWEGDTATGFANPDAAGTEADPYIIETAEQLRYLIENYTKTGASKGKFFKITKDIYLNDISNVNDPVDLWGKQNWLAGYGETVPVPADNVNLFEGTLDGDGHTIYGLYVNGVAFAGLFPAVSSYATIKNLSLEKVFITGGSGSAGAIAGWAEYTSWQSATQITNCSVVDATIGQAANIEFVGGLVGRIDTTSVTVTNCSASGLTLSQHTGHGIAGGLIGFAQAGGTLKINNSFSVGYFATCSQITKAICTNVYTTADIPEGYTNGGVTKLIDDQMKGDAAKANMAFDFDISWKVTSGYPVATGVEPWSGSAAAGYAGGNGTEDSPYLISNADQLFKMVQENTTVNTDGAFAELNYFKITKDIVINAVTDAEMEAAKAMAKPSDVVSAWDGKGYKTWNPGYTGNQTSKGFYGVVDGDGHTIHGLYIKEGQYVGLIPVIVDNASITNLKVENSFVRASSGSASPGVLVGIVYGKKNNYPTVDVTYTMLDNCYVSADAGNSSWRLGGVIGGAMDSKKITITNCAVTNIKMTTANTGTVGRAGAFLGNPGGGSHVISNCYTDSSTHPVSNTTDTQTNYDQLHKYVTFTNVYTSADKPTFDSYDDITYLTANQMQGENAKTFMPGLSYRFYWETVKGGYPVVNVRDGDLWDGTYGKSYEIFNNKGDGSKENPYLIENGAQLAFAVSYNRTLNDGSYYKLANDIILNDTEVENWEATAKPWIWNNHLRFNGTLDGDGHTIEGLYMSTDSVNGRGALIAYIGKDSSKDPNKVAEVKNITFKSASINSTATASATTLQGYAVVAGQTSGETLFENIYIDENCTVNGPYVTGVAGIIGRGYENGKGGFATIRNCAVLATINGGSLAGAFVGTYYADDANITIENSYADTNVGLIGKATIKTITDTYTTVLGSADTGATEVSAENMKGDAAKINMPKLDYYGVWKITDSYPVHRPVAERMASWGGAPADLTTISYAGGTGTKADPYLIANGDQLYKMVAENSNASVAAAPETQTYFRLTSDINLGLKQWYASSATAWITGEAYNTIGFNGVIYGDGHTVYNVHNNKVAGAAGLIPVATQGAEIHDLHIVGGYLPKVDYRSFALGGLIGLAKGAAGSTPIVIEGCSVDGVVVKGVNGAAGLVGYTYSQSLLIKDSYVVNSSLAIEEGASSAFIGTMGGSAYNNSFVVENSYTDNLAVPVMSEDFAAKTTFSNVYTTADDASMEGLTKLSDAEMKGKLGGFNYNQVWQTTDNGYSVHRDFAVQKELFTGTAALEYAGGTGTEEDPYLISNADQLYKLATATREETLGNFYKLTNDISISRVYDGWANDNLYTWAAVKTYFHDTYSDSFAGTLDGAGYTVSGLYYNNEITDGGNYAYGVIPFVTANAVIKNLTVKDVNATVTGDGASVGAVIGATHLTTADAENALNFVNLVGVKAENSVINGADDNSVIGKTATGVKIDPTVADENTLIFNALNTNEDAIAAIRNNLVGNGDKYITDVNAVEGFDIADLVYAVKKKEIIVDTDSYALVWAQEFDGDALDNSVWSFNTGMSQKTNLKYVEDNNEVSNGTLKLTATDSGEVDANGNKIYNVNKGICTIDTMSFKYGRLEMKAKIPFSAGAFPSLWLTSRDAIGYEAGAYGYDNEIDIFEVFGKSTSQNQMVTCIHKWYVDENGNRIKVDNKNVECSCGTDESEGNAYNISAANRSHTVKTEDAKAEWHTIVFEWTEDAMTFSVDGEIYYTAKKSAMDNASAFDFSSLRVVKGFDKDDYNTDNAGIFNRPMYLRLNNHMYTPGGTSYVFGGTDSQIDPGKLTYEIDYIKLYQKNDGKSEITLK